MSEDMKLGDTVRGTYYGVAVEGTISAFDMSHVYVQFAAPMTILDVERDGVAFDRYQSKTLKLIKPGPELTEDQVGFCSQVLGITYIRSE